MHSPNTHARMSHSTRLGGAPLRVVTSVATHFFKVGVAPNQSTMTVSIRWDAKINKPGGERKVDEIKWMKSG